MTSNKSTLTNSFSLLFRCQWLLIGSLCCTLLPEISKASTWKAAEKDHLKLDLGIISPAFLFDLRRTLGSEQSKIQYKPNSQTKTYLGFAYRNVSLGYGFTNKSNADDLKNLGETKSNDIQLRFIGTNSFEFSYQEYAGYYIENSEELDATYAGVPVKIQRSDIRTRNYSFMYLRNFDPEDFSFVAALTQSDRHTASGWGRFLFAGWNESFIQGDSPFVPAANAATFGDLSGLQKLSQKTLLGGLGLGGIASSGKWYVTGIMGLGMAAKSANSEFAGAGGKNLLGSGAAATVRFGMGYNGEWNVFGLQAIVDNTEISIVGATVSTQINEIKLFYSHRLDGISLPPLDYISSFLD